jgi:AraC-like DNA-binding protein
MRQSEALMPRYRTGQAVDIGDMLWSSSETEWSGFRFVVYRLRESVCVTGALQPCNQVAMCLAGRSDIQVTTVQGQQRSTWTEGALMLATKGLDYRILRWSGSSDLLLLDLDAAGTATIGPCGAEISPELRFLRDTQISTILSNMVMEARNGCPAGSRYGQCLSAALAAYVSARYTAVGPLKPSKPILVFAQREKVCDYIRRHLADDISLQDLAHQVGLSTSHFSALFRNTFACPPHQYLLGKRIDKARLLLAEQRLSIAEVAHATGFADQSHLTKSFRIATNMTPRQYVSLLSGS